MDLASQTRQLRKGDARAFAQLFDYYGQKLYAFAYSYLKNEADAEEVVQEVFLRVWKNREALDEDKSLHAYLFTIAFNAVKKAFLQRSKREAYKHEIIDELDAAGENFDFEQHYQFVLEKLELFIGEMPERRRMIFVGRKREGKSHKQIADEMGISVKTVENQITEAMHYIKSRFEQDVPEGLHLLSVFFSV